MVCALVGGGQLLPKVPLVHFSINPPPGRYRGSGKKKRNCGQHQVADGRFECFPFELPPWLAPSAAKSEGNVLCNITSGCLLAARNTCIDGCLLAAHQAGW